MAKTMKPVTKVSEGERTNSSIISRQSMRPVSPAIPAASS